MTETLTIVEPKTKKPTKKEQIISLFQSGITEVSDIAQMTRSRASYVGNVLHEAELVARYFDLYTPSSMTMNIYSKYFAGKVGFKDPETTKVSTDLIKKLYEEFGKVEDRAGQHHAMVVLLTLYNRARWTPGKDFEAGLLWESLKSLDVLTGTSTSH